MSAQYDSVSASSYSTFKTGPRAEIEAENVHIAILSSLSSSSSLPSSLPSTLPVARPTDLTVLDLACGTGRYDSLLINQWGIASRVVGLDISSKMIRAAKEAAMVAGIRDKTEYRVQDCAAPDMGQVLKDEGKLFDVVLGAFFLNYASSPAEMLSMWRNIAANLNPRTGVFVGVTPWLQRAAEGYRDDKFGVLSERVKDVEGGYGYKMRLTVEKTEPHVVFEYYALKEEIYTRCAEEAGMEEVKMLKPFVVEGLKGKEELTGKYWEEWNEKPHFGICVARRKG